MHFFPTSFLHHWFKPKFGTLSNISVVFFCEVFVAAVQKSTLLIFPVVVHSHISRFNRGACDGEGWETD